MKRSEDWDIRLDAFIRCRLTEPFKWGRHDCALFASDAIRAMTGVDLSSDFRGTYTGAESARRVMRKFAKGGLRQLAEKIAEQRGLEEIPVLKAQRGDIILVNTEQGPTLGVVSLDGWNCLGPGEDGLRKFELRECAMAWRIP